MLKTQPAWTSRKGVGVCVFLGARRRQAGFWDPWVGDSRVDDPGGEEWGAFPASRSSYGATLTGGVSFFPSPLQLDEQLRDTQFPPFFLSSPFCLSSPFSSSSSCSVLSQKGTQKAGALFAPIGITKDAPLGPSLRGGAGGGVVVVVCLSIAWEGKGARRGR